MGEYRLYFLDLRGGKEPFGFRCPDDQEAVAAAQVINDGRAMELWSHDRLVASWPEHSLPTPANLRG